MYDTWQTHDRGVWGSRHRLHLLGGHGMGTGFSLSLMLITSFVISPEISILVGHTVLLKKKS
jgi:hypothetical protein